jgi:hypothetical protein
LLNSRPQSSVVISFTRRVETPWWALLHQSQHQGLLRPLIPFEQLSSERPLSIARHLQLKPADPRGELPPVAPVAVTLPIVGPLLRAGTKVIGHLGLQNLVQDRLQQGGHASVPVEQLLDLLVRNRNLKSGHR